MRADRIEGLLGDFVRDVFMGPGYAIQLRDAVGRQLKDRSKKKNLDAAPIKSQLAKLDQQIDRAVGNLLLLDPANIPAAQKVLETKRERRAVLQSQLDDATGGRKPTNLPDDANGVNRVLAQLERLGERIRHADPAIASEAFRALFGSVSLFWHPKAGTGMNLRG